MTGLLSTVEQRAVAACFALLILLGAVITPAMGVSVDEMTQRQHRLVTMTYVLKAAGLSDVLPAASVGQVELRTYSHRHYGVTIQAPLFLLEYVVDYREPAYWLISHAYTHAIFLVSAFALYTIMRRLDLDYRVALGVVLLYVLNPRLYGHSFYNIKDLVFLSLFTIALAGLTRYLTRPTIGNLLLMVLATALAINSRMMGVILIPFLFGAVVWAHWRDWRATLKHGLSLALALPAVIYLTWPLLWAGSPREFVNAFLVFSDYEAWQSAQVFNGGLFSGDPPWYYIPTWIVITVPLGLLWLWFSALTTAPLLIVRQGTEWNTRYLLAVCVAAIVGSQAAVILFSSTLYGDWRHLYYLHGPFTIISGIFLQAVVRHSRRLALVFAVPLLLSGLSAGWWMVRNYPQFQLYFNPVAGSDWDQRWGDRDTWRLSMRQLLERIAAEEQLPLIPIEGHGTLRMNSWTLPPALRQRFVFVETSDEALFRLGYNRQTFAAYQDGALPGYAPAEQVLVDNKPIAVAYRRTAVDWYGQDAQTLFRFVEPARCPGSVDLRAAVDAETGAQYLEGWAYDPSAAAAVPLVVVLDERQIVVGLGSSGRLREDVAAALGNPAGRLSGWRIYLAGPPPPQATVYAVLDGGTALCPLP